MLRGGVRGVRAGVREKCAQAEHSAVLLNLCGVRRTYVLGACPAGPSAMFVATNVHTMAELNSDAQHCAGARNLLVFDKGFDATVERRLLKALLTRMFAVPRAAASALENGIHPVKHAITFTWLDRRVWVRVFRISRQSRPGEELCEIGPRMVLQPVSVIASCLGGAVLAETPMDRFAVEDTDPDPPV